MLEKSDKQTIKDALAASAKAISEDTELNVNFGIENLRQSSLPEPLQPVKNFNDLRAKSDQVALINKYSSDNLFTHRDAKVNEIMTNYLAKHNLPYHSWPTFTSALVSHYRMVKKLALTD